MKDKIFLDTNIFIYAIDKSPGEKKAKCGPRVDKKNCNRSSVQRFRVAFLLLAITNYES